MSDPRPLNWHKAGGDYISLFPFGLYRVYELTETPGHFAVLLNGDRIDRKHQVITTVEAGKIVAGLDYRWRVGKCFHA